MTIKSVWCPVMQSRVMCVTDLEGAIGWVICSEYEEATRTCRMKRGALEGGPLARLLTRVSENTLTDRTLRCAVV